MINQQALKAEAQRLGFLLCGITTPEPPPHLAQYKDWLAAGRHADMHYLDTARAVEGRASPSKLLPGCQSIIVLAAPYPAPSAQIKTGQIAAYARSTDYHNVFPPRLEALADWITRRANQPINWRAFTDTAPILEKDLAQRAGLGWIGKNSCLIHPQLGSYLLLAELFLDLTLHPDLPFSADRCGSCRRCIDACPTGCIRLDRTLDASHCLSYLTIENKGTIPPELRHAVADHVFGCDVCQTVCPWNQKVHISPAQTLFPPLQGLQHTLMTEDFQMDKSTFLNRFRHTPVIRAKRSGFLRNIAVALGNAARPENVPALAACLQSDPDPLLRAHAAWALGQHPFPDARSVLQASLAIESDPSVLKEICSVL
jgi:epoxyqueuosine reductase